MLIWECDKGVYDVLAKVRERHPKVEKAGICMSFNDSKVFRNGKFNWGTVSRFTPRQKLWLSKQYDFHISLPGDAWLSLLDARQREAWLDLHVTRCTVEYMPVTVEVNHRQKAVKDEFGRVQFTDQVKLDDDGNPKWKVEDLDLAVFASNVSRYGLWCSDLDEFSEAIKAKAVKT